MTYPLTEHFITNKYYYWYFRIINSIQKQNRVKTKDVYYEAHHIYPKCIFPEYKSFSKNKWNKILLTPKEHYICHLLLCKIVSNENKEKAFLAISYFTNNKKIKINSKIFQYLKQNHIDSIKGTKNPFYGKKHSEETKKKLSEQRKGVSSGPHSLKTREKMSKSHIGKEIKNESIQKFIQTRKENGTLGLKTFLGKKHSNKSKNLMKEYAKNHKASSETKQKMSEQRSGSKFINKDGKLKRVQPSEIESYLSEGWTLGYPKR